MAQYREIAHIQHQAYGNNGNRRDERHRTLNAIGKGSLFGDGRCRLCANEFSMRVSQGARFHIPSQTGHLVVFHNGPRDKRDDNNGYNDNLHNVPFDTSMIVPSRRRGMLSCCLFDGIVRQTCIRVTII